MDYRHDATMGEISGFGGDYESTCQDMLEAGVHWLLNNPGLAAQLVVADSDGHHQLVDEGHPARQSLGETITAVAPSNISTTQYGAVIRRLGWISYNSWDAYVNELRLRESEIPA